MAVWKFQLLPHTPNLLGKGYSMDAVGQGVEDEVNQALPYRFRFHKVTKLVLLLGSGAIQEEPYRESLGVAQKLVQGFDLSKYSKASDEHRRSMLREVVLNELNW